MQCMMEDAMGEQVPNSHFSRSKKISSIFGTPGNITGHAMCYPHWFGIGDHRVMLLEFSAQAAFNDAYPTIATPTARTLNCAISRIRRRYCDKLQQLTETHNLERRLHNIETLQGDAYIHAHNQWDTELGDYMRCAEQTCMTRSIGLIDYSPTVGQWLKQRAILKWILRWHEEKVPDIRNLLRAARCHQIENPLQLTKAEVEHRLIACINEAYALQTQAPSLRQKHLHWRLQLAKRQRGELATLEITRIIKNEARKRRQHCINKYVKEPKG